jgi:hypothetical protein
VLSVAILFAAAHVAGAQSSAPSSPTPPAGATNAPAVKTPPVPALPPRPSNLPTAQRTPPPPLSLKPAAVASAVPVSSRRPDSAKVVAPVKSASDAPSARIANPPRKLRVAIAPAATKTVLAAEVPPIGATMRCKDGTYLTGAPSTDRCSSNGGVAATYPAQSSAPPAPRPQPQKRP